MNPEEIRAANAKKIFQNKLPVLLKQKDPSSTEGSKEDQKVKPREENKDVSSNPEQSSNIKKEETSYDLGTSEMEQSEDEHRKKDQQRKERIEKDLEQVIYISIAETPTSILFYSPSTKCLTLKNGSFIFFIF